MKLRDLFCKKHAAPEAATPQVMSPVLSLYEELSSPEYQNSRDVEISDLGEDMTLVKESICGWWKPRFLVDNRAKVAFEFLTLNEYFVNFSADDVDWESLKSIPEKVMQRARNGYAGYPTLLDPYQNGQAKVYWQINPDGYYFMDEDGYGMTDDEEIELVGAIDRTGKIVKRFSLRKA